MAQIDQAVFGGRANAEWLSKTLGGTDFKMALLLEDAVGAPPFAFKHSAPQISAEVSYLATDVSPEVLKAYDKAKKGIEKKTMSGLVLALGQLKYVTDESPDFAPGQFLLAKCALHFKRRAFALECLNEAVTSAGGFAEALALRARRRCCTNFFHVDQLLFARAHLELFFFQANPLALGFCFQKCLRCCT